MSLLPVKLSPRSERLGDLESLLEGLELAVGSRTAARIANAIMKRMVERTTPLIVGDMCHFLVDSPLPVSVVGDWNGWNPNHTPMRPLSRFSTLWHHAERFPIDARLAYRFVINGHESINDPLNPHIEREVFGDNTAFRMPGYAMPEYAEPSAKEVRKGRIRTIAIQGIFARQVKVWMPPKIDKYAELKVLYVHDGEETERIGKILNVLNNLYHFEPLTPPILVVLVSPSQRNLEYKLNADFAAWFCGELVPLVEEKVRLRGVTPARRGIMGASLGGLLSAYVGMLYSEVFGNIVAQSPSFWVENKLLIRQFAKLERLPLRWYLHTGTIADAEEGSRDMLRVLQQKGYPVTYRETRESHNWANWRGKYAEIVRWFAQAEKTEH